MRDLASVCTVDKAWALEGKDRVHGISMVENGYEAMVGKDIQPGDLVAFIQEGALLPAEIDKDGNAVGTWAFLMNLKCYKPDLNKYLIKVKKFKEIRSWGLVLRLDQIGLNEKTINKLKAGDDITELLKIEKYEEQEEASPKKQTGLVHFLMKYKYTRWIGKIILNNKKSAKSGGFPSYIISKSDETTIQNKKYVTEKFADNEIYVTCKMEGQSGTYLFDKKGKKPTCFFTCSRNIAYRAKVSNDYWAIAEKYDLKKKILDYYKKTGKLLVIQGEQCGPGIQENIYGFKDLHLFVYTIKDAITGMQFGFEEMLSVCKELDLETVPVIGKFILKDVMPDLDTAVTFAEGQYWKPIGDGKVDYFYKPKKGEKLWKDYFQHEGVVVRTINYDKDKNIGDSWKIKNCEYAEKGLKFINEASKTRR